MIFKKTDFEAESKRLRQHGQVTRAIKRDPVCRDCNRELSQLRCSLKQSPRDGTFQCDDCYRNKSFKDVPYRNQMG